MSLVSFRDVQKSYRSLQGAEYVAVEHFSLDIEAGEFFCLLGPSGCGKTTVLKMLAGFEGPTAGQIVMEGRLVTAASRDRGVVFQGDDSLYGWLTAGENVELALKLRGVGKASRKEETERLLALVRLEGAGEKRPHELSGGMRQRVAMARALAQDSKVLLMDEPFAALDAITRDVLHDELTRIRQEVGATVLFVTHNVREAVRLGDRVVLLSSRPGRVANEFAVDIPQPRRIESPEVASLSVEITEHLRTEIRRHAQGATR